MPKLPSERDWERSELLEPRPGPREPELISDGGGLPFPPAALAAPPAPLDPEDPAAAALLAHLAAHTKTERGSRVPWKRSAPAPPGLDGWRLLARTDGEVLFALGHPSRLLTVALRQDGRRGRWKYVGSNSVRPLRVIRDGIRASSWRVDPAQEPQPEETVLRVLVTEQAFANGQRANGRVLTPDIYIDDDELILRVFVTPRPGHQGGAPNPETPVRIALPHPLGRRRPIDGALIELSAPNAPPRPPAGSD
jgi:hypothetical protein